MRIMYECVNTYLLDIWAYVYVPALPVDVGCILERLKTGNDLK